MQHCRTGNWICTQFSVNRNMQPRARSGLQWQKLKGFLNLYSSTYINSKDWDEQTSVSSNINALSLQNLSIWDAIRYNVETKLVNEQHIYLRLSSIVEQLVQQCNLWTSSMAVREWREQMSFWMFRQTILSNVLSGLLGWQVNWKTVSACTFHYTH